MFVVLSSRRGVLPVAAGRHGLLTPRARVHAFRDCDVVRCDGEDDKGKKKSCEEVPSHHHLLLLLLLLRQRATLIAISSVTRERSLRTGEQMIKNSLGR